MNLLFICSKNRWRSPTAEQVFRNEPTLEVRSRGVSQKAKRVVRSKDIEWADLVLVMESEHRKRLAAAFPSEMSRAVTHVLDIPDDYEFMDPALIELLEASVRPLLASRGEDLQ